MYELQLMKRIGVKIDLNKNLCYVGHVCNFIHLLILYFIYLCHKKYKYINNNMKYICHI